VSDVLGFLESLPPGPLYALVAVFSALENIFPPIPADTALGLGAFLAGRGRMDAWAVFWVGWGANVATGAAVFFLARRYGRAFFRGRLGRRLLPRRVLERIEHEYERHGTYGVFLARLLPVWRGVVMPFAGVARLHPVRAIVPMALAGALYYGGLVALIATLAANLDDVVRFIRGVNAVLAALAALVLVGAAIGVVRALKR
jgi:membrane protein DedA with SNARE-associated domain